MILVSLVSALLLKELQFIQIMNISRESLDYEILASVENGFITKFSC